MQETPCNTHHARAWLLGELLIEAMGNISITQHLPGSFHQTVTGGHHNHAILLTNSVCDVVPHLVTSRGGHGQALERWAMGRNIPRIEGVQRNPGSRRHRGNQLLAGHKRSGLQIDGSLRTIKGRNFPGGLQELLVGLQEHRCPRLHPLRSHLDDEGVLRKDTQRRHQPRH